MRFLRKRIDIMSVNIFGSIGKHASGVNSNVGLGGVDRNLNQRFIILSNILSQKKSIYRVTQWKEILNLYINQNQHVIRYLWVSKVWIRIPACRSGWVIYEIKYFYANGSPINFHAEHGFEFTCILGHTTKFDHDIIHYNKNVTGHNSSVSSSDAVNK